MRFWAIVAIAGLAVAEVLRQAAHLLPSDAYLALASGRDIAQHGLPSVDTWATVTRGRAWVDAQWLGQLTIYGLERAGGLRLLLAAEALVTGAAFAVTARHAMQRGTTLFAALISALVGLFFCAIFFGVRPQMFALVLFALVFAAIEQEVPPRKLVLTIPWLVLWANVHGSVLFGAALVGLRALVSGLAALQQRRTREFAGFAGVGVLAAVSPLASPYAAQLPSYFISVWRLQDPERQLPILEWAPLTWSNGWLFFVAVGVVLVLLALRRNEANRFAAAVLVLTALAAWRANRNVQFFGLAFAAYVPALLFPYLPRVSLRVTQICAVLSLALVVTFGARAALVSDLESDLPTAALPALHQALLDDPVASAVISDRFADWALWHEPLLQGRLAFDVRFELLSDDDARQVAQFFDARPGWQALYPDAHIVLVSKRLHHALSAQVTRLPNARTLWDDTLSRLVLR